jgi:hypothetical protein
MRLKDNAETCKSTELAFIFNFILINLDYKSRNIRLYIEGIDREWLGA